MHHQPHPIAPDQVLTAAQMRDAEQRLMDAGTDVHTLMQRAGRGAAEWVWRIASGAPVTVLCGPGNNGGDGYVIAETLRERSFPVQLVAALPPATDAAKRAASLYSGPVVDAAGFDFQTELGPDTFAVVEKWQDADALKAHAAAPHMAAYAAKVGDLIAERAVYILTSAE